jgi:LCP family protein required for cell wall assembly
VSTTQQDSPPQTAGPSSRARRWWLRWRRVVAVVAGLVALAVLVLVGMVISIDRSIDRVEVEGLGGDDGGTEATDQPGDRADAAELDPDLDDRSVTVNVDVDPVTVLVLGSDTREVLTPEERVELGTGNAYGERTEVVALVRVDPVNDELRMLNVPRDSVMTRCDGSRGRINATYTIGENSGVGGMSCVVTTLTEWSGLTIDHAMKVDFRGFVDIVDALGGVEFQLDEPLQDDNANLDLAAGCVRLDGADALAFARARGIDNDFGRIARQQRLIAEMRAELGEAGVLSDPVRLVRTAEAVARAVELDDQLTLNRIRQLVMAHRSTLRADIEARTVPGEQVTGTEAWLLAPDEDAAVELFRWLEEGDPDPTGTGGDVQAADDAPDAGATDDGPDAGRTDDASADEDPAGSNPQRCG